MSDLSELAEEAAEADDSVWFKDNRGRIIRGLAEGAWLEAEVAKFRQDYHDAAGELLVDINDAQPGTLVSKLLIANRIMARDRDRTSEAYQQALESLELAEKHSDGFAKERDALREQLRSITTLDPEEHKTVLALLNEALEREAALKKAVVELAKDARCKSVDPSTGLQCEFNLDHKTDLHSNETFAWEDEGAGEE